MHETLKHAVCRKDSNGKLKLGHLYHLLKASKSLKVQRLRV